MKSCTMKCLCQFSKPDTALLIIRVCVAAIFIYAGVQKLTTLEVTTGMFMQMGIPGAFAWIVGILEALGGLAVGLGFVTIPAAAILAVIMLVATVIMARFGGIMAAMNPFAYLFSTVALCFSGAGKYSMDTLCPCGANNTCGTDTSCACCGDSTKCECDETCPDCDCNKDSFISETMKCVCSNDLCVCDTACTDCKKDCKK